ncbi:MAG: hypothetical protein ACOYMQ_14455, partial [Pseudanabaena sp.]
EKALRNQAYARKFRKRTPMGRFGRRRPMGSYNDPEDSESNGAADTGAADTGAADTGVGGNKF